MDWIGIKEFLFGLDWIEITAALFGLACVVLTVKQNIWCWPTGLVQVSLYIPVFYTARLYSDLGLHVIYFVLQIYGWYNWLYGGKEKAELKVTRIGIPEAALWVAVAAAGIIGLGMFTTTLGAALQYWDAATTVLSLIAQYLLARKLLESWLILIAVDVMVVWVSLVKGLYPTTILYAMFFCLATAGFLEWRKSYLNPEPA